VEDLLPKPRVWAH